MAEAPRLMFLLDVDNTLLDNDAAKDEIGRQLVQLLGASESERFWRCYEDVRHETGVVSFPLTLWHFLHGRARLPHGDRRQLHVALADLLMTFPYDQFLFPGALAAITHLRTLGHVAILSDGDPAFQPSKIIRSGLGRAVGGYILVYPHKEEHLDEVTAAFPADHYVLVEDRPTVISRVRENMTEPLTTVHVLQGKYTHDGGPNWQPADLTLTSIGDLAGMSVSRFISSE